MTIGFTTLVDSQPHGADAKDLRALHRRRVRRPALPSAARHLAMLQLPAASAAGGAKHVGRTPSATT